MEYRHFNMNEEKVNSQIKVDDTLYQTQLTKKFLNRQKYVPRDPLLLTTQIPGVVKSIFVKEGDRGETRAECYDLGGNENAEQYSIAG